MSILIFVFSLSLSQYRCLCIVFVVSYIFVSVWISLPSSSPGYSGNVLMWLENSIQDFGPPELSLQSRISGSSEFWEFNSFHSQSWIDLMLTLEFWKNDKMLLSGVLKKDVDQLAPEYKGTWLQFGKCPLMNIFTRSTLHIRKLIFPHQ